MLAKKFSRNFISIQRFAYSTQVNEIDYKNAKPFSDIPGIKSPFTGKVKKY
jgi:hypothetical protein